MRVATLDVGTNSVLLLVADTLDGGALAPVVERATVTRLGQGVDRTRALAPEAIERTLACLDAYGRELRALGAERVDVVGTSAMRDATGGDAFVARAAELLGVAPRVISGDEEARLTFRGALTGLSRIEGDVTVFDVGGGSTEIVHGAVRDGVAEQSAGDAPSLDVGSVRFTERFVQSDPPSAAELLRAGDEVTRQLEARARVPSEGATLVGIAGTVTTLAAVARAIAPYDSKRVHGAVMSRDEIRATASRLARAPLAERRAIVGLEPARADVIPVGAVIVERVLEWARKPSLVVSDRGVRWGLALELARRGARADAAPRARNTR